ncbi:hypothetical protein TCAL_09844 [Tigriopus californicus]|uniref:Gustatory receptor n=1 Tax=Tigriopus californicus TaxID=6832 RepID=A0A553PAU1_TIGCA|nr:uncharacterized protein LOC131893279 [Tigriopus californicus]TRY74802.1 hypothetical protein TCAL_09844 [Tigriopus californicus]
MFQVKESKVELQLFQPFARILTCLEWIGLFPLTLTPDGRQFLYRKSAILKSILLIVFIFLCLLSAAYVGFYDTPNIFLIGVQLSKQLGLSQTDFVAFFIVYPLGFFNMIFHTLEMKRAYHGINEVVQNLIPCCRKTGVTQKDLKTIYKDTRCILVGFFICLLGSWACCFLFQYRIAQVVESGGKRISNLVLYAGLWSVGTVIGMFSPNQAVSIFFSVYITNVINLCMRKFSTMMQKERKEYPEMKKTKISVVPIPNTSDLNTTFPPNVQTREAEELGTMIHQILEGVSHTFGPLFFMNLGYSFLCVIVFSFCSINLISPIVGGNFNIPALVFGGQCLFLLTHASHINERLYQAGQKLKDSSSKIGQSLTELYLEDYDLMTKSERARFKDVRSRFQNVTPIRPHNFIDLDVNTYLVTNGLIITYVIVLLQFKIGEDPNEGSRVFNCSDFNSSLFQVEN